MQTLSIYLRHCSTLICALWLAAITGCSEDLEPIAGPTPYPEHIIGGFNIMLIDNNGDNWLEALANSTKNETHQNRLLKLDEHLKDFTTVINNESGKVLHQVTTVPVTYGAVPSEVQFKFEIPKEEAPKEKAVYTMELSSDRWLQPGEKHTAKWYVEYVEGRYNCYRCEVDGKEVAVPHNGIGIYRKIRGREYRMPFTPLITIQIKKGAK